MPSGGAAIPGPGDLFDRRYRIERRVGSGGFAQIFKAETEDMGRTVALKILMPQMPPPNYYSDELASRFSREARAVSDLRSAYSVTLYHFGRSDDGLLYMVFEYVDGETVADVLDEEGAMAVERVVKILEQLLLSLHEIHEAGLLHRDIKPANVMLTDYLGDADHVKLVDFGIAKSWVESRNEDGLGDLTARDQIVGTPRYMAPEQIVGEPVSPATDFYSLGLVAWEMLAGEPCVSGDDVTDLMRQHLDRKPFELPSVELPDALRDILRQMVEKSRSRRPKSAVDILAVLEREFGGGPGLLPLMKPPDDTTAPMEPRVSEAVGEHASEPEDLDETVPLDESHWPSDLRLGHGESGDDAPTVPEDELETIPVYEDDVPTQMYGGEGPTQKVATEEPEAELVASDDSSAVTQRSGRASPENVLDDASVSSRDPLDWGFFMISSVAFFASAVWAPMWVPPLVAVIVAYAVYRLV